MDNDNVLFRVDDILSNLRLIWGNSSIKGTYLLNGRYLVNLEGSHTEMLRDLINEVNDAKLRVRVTDYDQRCDALFLLISDPAADLVTQ